MAWVVGTKLVRKHSPELGVGVVLDVDGPFIDVFFPDAMERMRLRPEPESVLPVVFVVGDEVLVPGEEGESSLILSIDEHLAILQNGQTHPVDSLWPVLNRRGPLERLLDGELDAGAHVLNRLDGIRLQRLRGMGGVGGLLGGRIELFPHQIGTAAKALDLEKVRWLLADEVGLGKTIIAHMITAALLRTERVSRVVVVAPETLTVQWLGELYRKFHQVFVHVDPERVDDVRVEIGESANPFEIYPMSIISYEFLESDSSLFDLLCESSPDLVVVDEAHRTLSSPVGEAVLGLVAVSLHSLLLTATPFQMGGEGFMRLVGALGLPNDTQPNGRRVVRQTSVVTRDEVPQLPNRQTTPIRIPTTGDLGCGDPRVRWLSEMLPAWKKEHTKALIFVNDSNTAKHLHKILSQETRLELFVFSEDMDTKVRDIELSRFRMSSSPALISSGAGSEGRNFQFCDHVVHFELPLDPTILEQRIGRIDRIGKVGDVFVFYFIQDDGVSELVTAYSSLGVFDDASIGSSPAMSVVRDYFLNDSGRSFGFEEMIRRTKTELKLYEGQWLFIDSHQLDEDHTIMSQLPEDHELLFERFCVDAAERIGFDVVEKEGVGTYFFEHGADVTVEVIPGVPRGGRFLGTFDREEAINNLELDFFANGHVLVEGLLAELEDSEIGRVGAIRLARRRIAAEYGLGSLSGQHHVLLIRGGVEPYLEAFELRDGVFSLLEPDIAVRLFHATEHGRPIGKKAHRENLRQLRDMAFPTRGDIAFDVAVWVEWVN